MSSTATMDIVLSISNGSPLLNYRQASKALNQAPQTLRNLVSTGSFPLPPIRFGRSVRFRATDIANMIDRGAK